MELTMPHNRYENNHGERLMNLETRLTVTETSVTKITEKLEGIQKTIWQATAVIGTILTLVKFIPWVSAKL